MSRRSNGARFRLVVTYPTGKKVVMAERMSLASAEWHARFLPKLTPCKARIEPAVLRATRSAASRPLGAGPKLTRYAGGRHSIVGVGVGEPAGGRACGLHRSLLWRGANWSARALGANREVGGPWRLIFDA